MSSIKQDIARRQKEKAGRFLFPFVKLRVSSPTGDIFLRFPQNKMPWDVENLFF